METVSIYNRDNELLIEVPVTSNTKYINELMTNEYVQVEFNHYKPNLLSLGDYIMYNGVKFKVIDLSYPTNGTNGGYKYTQQFAAPWVEAKHFKLLYDRGTSIECGWTKTGFIDSMVALIVENIERAIGLKFKYSSTLKSTFKEMKNCDFSDTIDIISALNTICDSTHWNTEWWIENYVDDDEYAGYIHIANCEVGTLRTLTDNKEIKSISRSESQNNNNYTRLYAFGSTKNVTKYYCKDLVFTNDKNPPNQGSNYIRDSSKPLKAKCFPSECLHKKETSVMWVQDNSLASGVITTSNNFINIFQNEQNLFTCERYKNGSYRVKSLKFSLELEAENKGNKGYVVGGGYTWDDIDSVFCNLFITSSNSENETEIFKVSPSNTPENTEQVYGNSYELEWVYNKYTYYYKYTLNANIDVTNLMVTLDELEKLQVKMMLSFSCKSRTIKLNNRSGVQNKYKWKLKYEYQLIEPWESADTIVVCNGKEYNATWNINHANPYTSEGNVIYVEKAIYGGQQFRLKNIRISEVDFSYLIDTNDKPKAYVDRVSVKRLTMPGGNGYVDVYENMPQEQVVEGVVINENIFPEITFHITDVITVVQDKEEQDEYTGEMYKPTYYDVVTQENNFDSSYIIDGEKIHGIFQTGKLAGMDFEMQWNPLGGINEKNRFRIVPNENYGGKLPVAPYLPVAGDTFILYGFDTAFLSDSAIPEAEKRLQEWAESVAEYIRKDRATYECTMNLVECIPYKLTELPLGQSVKFCSKVYGNSELRIRKIDRQLDNRGLKYTIGISPEKSRLKSLENSIKSGSGGSSGGAIFFSGSLSGSSESGSGSGTGSSIKVVQCKLSEYKEWKRLGQIDKDTYYEIINVDCNYESNSV